MAAVAPLILAARSRRRRAIQEWSVADRAGIRVVDVEIVCSDEVEHRRRVESRAADIPGHRVPTWPEVVERDYHPWDRERIVIDTARLGVQQNVRAILALVSRTDDALIDQQRAESVVAHRRRTGGRVVNPSFVIKAGAFDDDRVKALLSRHLEGMHANSPPGHVFALDWSGLQTPQVSFYAVWKGEELLGFGALKELDRSSGEIKSMRTADSHLRQGVAAALLEYVIDEARRRGYVRLSLETGSGPAFEPALSLYRKYGFKDGAAFDGYRKSPFNQFLHLDLSSTGP